MKKLKLRIKPQLSPYLIIAVLFGVLSVSSVLASYNPDLRTLIAQELANRIPTEALYKLLGLSYKQTKPAEAKPVEEATLGAAGGTLFGPVQCVNDDCQAHLVQTSISASSTIFSVTDPFLMSTTTAGDVVVTPSADLVNGIGQTGATSTVELARINVTTAATTTYSVMCASAPNPFATSSVSQTIIETGTSVTSTPVIESGFYNPPVNNVGGGTLSVPWYSTASTTLSRIMLTPAEPYLICKVHPATNSAFVGNPNFVAKLLLRISRLRF